MPVGAGCRPVPGGSCSAASPRPASNRQAACLAPWVGARPLRTSCHQAANLAVLLHGPRPRRRRAGAWPAGGRCRVLVAFGGHGGVVGVGGSWAAVSASQGINAAKPEVSATAGALVSAEVREPNSTATTAPRPSWSWMTLRGVSATPAAKVPASLSARSRQGRGRSGKSPSLRPSGQRRTRSSRASDSAPLRTAWGTASSTADPRPVARPGRWSWTSAPRTGRSRSPCPASPLRRRRSGCRWSPSHLPGTPTGTTR